MRANSIKKVDGRIRKLELRFGATLEALRRAVVPSGAEQIAQRLARFGIVRSPKESLAETTAGAMGISVRELRAELERRAAGLTA